MSARKDRILAHVEAHGGILNAEAYIAEASAPDHPDHEYFFGRSDAVLAREYRETVLFDRFVEDMTHRVVKRNADGTQYVTEVPLVVRLDEVGPEGIRVDVKPRPRPDILDHADALLERLPLAFSYLYELVEALAGLATDALPENHDEGDFTTEREWQRAKLADHLVVIRDLAPEADGHLYRLAAEMAVGWTATPDQLKGRLAALDMAGDYALTVRNTKGFELGSAEVLERCALHALELVRKAEEGE